jgi:hypothetical protein
MKVYHNFWIALYYLDQRRLQGESENGHDNQPYTLYTDNFVTSNSEIRGEAVWIHLKVLWKCRVGTMMVSKETAMQACGRSVIPLCEAVRSAAEVAAAFDD